MRLTELVLMTRNRKEQETKRERRMFWALLPSVRAGHRQAVKYRHLLSSFFSVHQIFVLFCFY